jgi:hypothetical protein
LSALIDVWNTETFDQELLSKLRASEQLVRDYLTTDRRQYEEREASDHWHARLPARSRRRRLRYSALPPVSLRLLFLQIHNVGRYTSQLGLYVCSLLSNTGGRLWSNAVAATTTDGPCDAKRECVNLAGGCVDICCGVCQSF